MIVRIGKTRTLPDKGYVRPPQFPYWTAGLLLKGENRLENEMQSIVQKGNHLCLVRPFVPYRIHIGNDLKYYHTNWMIFSPPVDWLKWLSFSRAGIVSISLSKIDLIQMRDQFDEVFAFHNGKNPMKDRFATNALEKYLLMFCERVPEGEKQDCDKRVLETMDHLSVNLSREHSVKDLAGRFGISPSHFSHLFAKESGMSPMAYLQEVRLKRACELLRNTDESIAQISEKVGYESQLHFSKLFRKKIGESPRDYRKTELNPHY